MFKYTTPKNKEEVLFLAYDYLLHEYRWTEPDEALEVIKSYGFKSWSELSITQEQLEDEGLIIGWSDDWREVTNKAGTLHKRPVDMSTLSKPKRTLYRWITKGS